MVERAGLLSGKYSLYILFTCSKFFKSAINTVALITFLKEEPDASNTALRFSITLFVCWLISPSMSLFVDGSIGICPDVNIKFPALIACSYGLLQQVPYLWIW